MNRIGFVIVAVFACMSLHLFGEDTTADLRRSETILKADKLFGQRYTATAGKPLKLYDEDTETGPPDAVRYWHGSSYIVELSFATDGTVARMTLLPEALVLRCNGS